MVKVRIRRRRWNRVSETNWCKLTFLFNSCFSFPTLPCAVYMLCFLGRVDGFVTKLNSYNKIGSLEAVGFGFVIENFDVNMG